MLKLTPVLGDFRLVTEKELGPIQRGSGNSTRWIIQIEHKLNETEEPRRIAWCFALYRNQQRVLPSVHVFTFGAQNSSLYDARPSLDHADGVFTLCAREDVPARYLLSIDILHSLYR